MTDNKKETAENMIEIALGLPPLGIKYSRKWKSDHKLIIVGPDSDVATEDYVSIQGNGGPKGLRVMLINWIIGNRCYLQDGVAKSDSNGIWHAQSFLSPLSVGKERFVYAIAVKPEAVEQVKQIFAETKILEIPDLEEKLKERKISYMLSEGKKLIRISAPKIELEFISPQSPINPSLQDPYVLQRSVTGKIVGLTEAEINQMQAVVSISIKTDKWYPQGTAKVKDDGTWILPKAHFGSTKHVLQAELKDKDGRVRAKKEINLLVVRGSK